MVFLFHFHPHGFVVSFGFSFSYQRGRRKLWATRLTGQQSKKRTASTFKTDPKAPATDSTCKLWRRRMSQGRRAMRCSLMAPRAEVSMSPEGVLLSGLIVGPMVLNKPHGIWWRCHHTAFGGTSRHLVAPELACFFLGVRGERTPSP